MSNFNRKQKRGKKVKGLKFIPKLLTDKEVRHYQSIKCNTEDNYNTVSVNHSTDKLDPLMMFPSDKSKEIWAIIYNCKPSQLQDWEPR